MLRCGEWPKSLDHRRFACHRRTLAASAKLVEMAGGYVSEIGKFIELSFLEGRKNLSAYNVFSMFPILTEPGLVL
ncbi:MAG: hypothetical protein CM1200mP22_11050 [Dehalococcoidia bacterium]|nr:MAG: hypothetical protein CM1200mP22_11050 [Dehalococcoidia bacterium]